MSTVNIYGQYSDVVSSESGLDVIGNSLTIILDPNPNNDVSILSRDCWEMDFL